ncbi:hypothetical protein KR059_006888 [Drosophila kikkawai]|nr:hypothetical protein KR059_006888 [Drosophila kikkawai]
MINIQSIENVSDCTPLYLPHSLYLKPVAKMQISVSLPTIKSGKSVSNLEIMDKLGVELKPDKFLLLKVSKSTVNTIRLEAELDDRKRLRLAIQRLDGVSLRITGFSESFRVRCTQSKDEFPTRHDWDSYFRDARNMDEMKAGERPDTIHLSHLPMRWFCPRHTEHEEQVKPSESIFKRIFEKFGRVRAVDIPICDPYRKSMQADINGMRTFSFEQDVLFEAYVQFEEYSSFVRAMDEFRGTKLVRKFVDKTQAINICVNFDKQKHLSDSHVQRRERMRKKCIAKAQAEDEEREKLKKQKAEQLERERFENSFRFGCGNSEQLRFMTKNEGMLDIIAQHSSIVCLSLYRIHFYCILFSMPSHLKFIFIICFPPPGEASLLANRSLYLLDEQLTNIYYA